MSASSQTDVRNLTAFLMVLIVFLLFFIFFLVGHIALTPRCPHAQSPSVEVGFDRMGLETPCGSEEARTATGTRAGGRFSQISGLALELLSFPNPRQRCGASSQNKRIFPC